RGKNGTRLGDRVDDGVVYRGAAAVMDDRLDRRSAERRNARQNDQYRGDQAHNCRTLQLYSQFQRFRPSRLGFVTRVALAAVALASPAFASDALQLSGFALGRGSSHSSGPPLGDDGGNAHLQLGIDWRPSVALGTP